MYTEENTTKSTPNSASISTEHIQPSEQINTEDTLRNLISIERVSQDFKETNESDKHVSDVEDVDAEQYFDKLIDDSNKFFLIKILSPEITENENKKREHKDKLIGLVKTFLIMQFAIVALLMIGTLVMIFVFHGCGKTLALDHIDTIFKYIALYITSVVVELVTMLKFIVEKVFDTSITTLVELYKDTKNEENEDDTGKVKKQ